VAEEHEIARGVLEYFPSPLHSEHAEVPPFDAFPASQSPHVASLVVRQSSTMCLPALQLQHAVHPTAPSVLNFPAPHTVHSVRPPMLNLPGTQSCTPVRSLVGFLPAGADKHAFEPGASEYFPSPLHAMQSSTPPEEAVPAMHLSLAVLSEFVLFPAATENQ